MKLAIMSDFHLDYDKTGEDAHGQAEEALKRASKTADALLILGDVFDSLIPDAKMRSSAARLFEGLHNLPIISVAGNHERIFRRSDASLNLQKVAGIVELDGGVTIIAKESEKVAVYGIGNVEDARFSKLIKTLNPTPREGCFNIFMFHQSIFELLPSSIASVSTDELPKGFDLYLNGHIHDRTELRVHGKPFLIPGSTVFTRMEANPRKEKGFYLYDTVSNNYSFNLVEKIPLKKLLRATEHTLNSGNPQKVT
jgi:DNA repair exonuclease SbcCD nuclease subunit